MKENNITIDSRYNNLIIWFQNKTRNMLRGLYKDKVALYWSDIDTYYQKYQDNDVIVYWGNSGKFEPVKELYKN